MLFEYTFKERIIIKISQKIMPIVSVLCPSNRLVTKIWKLLGVQVGKGSLITKDTKINVPFNVEIGTFSVINGNLLSREKIQIGSHVELLNDVYISTQSHDLYSPGHLSIYKPVIIEDFCWIAPRSIILQGVNLKKGSVVAAASVVSKSNQEEYDILVGTPAKVKGKRILFDDCFREDVIDIEESNIYEYFQHKVKK